jgi:hypothetical protein
MKDEEIKQEAENYARKNKDEIAQNLSLISTYIPDTTPISIFMAGSPGAGKTEFSKSLIDIMDSRKVVRIDSDDLRNLLPGYTGKNSHLFQGATSILVDKIHDKVLKNKQTFIFDGTLSNYERAVRNISRSLEKSRKVFVFYIYQKPEVAWNFTQEREVVEHRKINKSDFINHFIESQKTLSLLRVHFGTRITIIIVRKNFQTNKVEEMIEIEPKDPSIDDFMDMVYTADILNEIL